MPPDQVTCLPVISGIFHYGLSVRCVQGKVDDLLNRTRPEAGTSGSTIQVWGVTGTRLDLRSTQEVKMFPA